jgi:hypothetical protein
MGAPTARIIDLVWSKNANVLKTLPKLRTLGMLRDCISPASASVGGARAVGNDRATESVSGGHGHYDLIYIRMGLNTAYASAETGIFGRIMLTK